MREKAFFRQVMGQFATGVTIVTTATTDGVFGLTVNAFTSVSLDPPLIAICVDLRSQTLSCLRASGSFAVNVLEASQEALSQCFATPSVERYESFCHVPYQVAVTGSPVLNGVLAFLDARIVAEYPGGDHVIILGQVEALGTSGTIQRHLRKHAQLERFGSRPQLIVVPATLLEHLAQFLLIPEEALLATTYHAELARLYGSAHPHGRLFSPQCAFHVCPACVAHTRLLTRTLMWPHLHYCPLHQIELRNRCQCGAMLWLFSGKAAPFTCVACGLDWGALPHHQIPRTRVRRERQLGSFYEYFLTSGTPRRLEYATEVLRQQQKEKSMLSWREHPKVIPYRKKFSLGYVVERLVSASVSVQDIRPYWLESDR